MANDIISRIQNRRGLYADLPPALAEGESAEPMIAETDDITVIIDGETVTFNSYNEGTDAPEWTLFTLRYEDSY